MLRKWVVEKFSVEYDLSLVFSFIGNLIIMKLCLEGDKAEKWICLLFDYLHSTSGKKNPQKTNVSRPCRESSETRVGRSRLRGQSCVCLNFRYHTRGNTQRSVWVSDTSGPCFLGIEKCQFPTAKISFCFVPGNETVENKMHGACGKGECSTLLAVQRVLNFSSPELNKALWTFFIPVPWVKTWLKRVHCGSWVRKQHRTCVVSHWRKPISIS